jgi:hypothetical protein
MTTTKSTFQFHDNGQLSQDEPLRHGKTGRHLEGYHQTAKPGDGKKASTEPMKLRNVPRCRTGHLPPGAATAAPMHLRSTTTPETSRSLDGLQDRVMRLAADMTLTKNRHLPQRQGWWATGGFTPMASARLHRDFRRQRHQRSALQTVLLPAWLQRRAAST